MHKSRLAGLVLDCKGDNLDAAADFWTSALGYNLVTSGPDDDKYRTMDVADNEVTIEVQKVDHPSRVHIDIETNDIEAEAARLESLGARRLEAIRDWLVMEAPTGQRFCLVKPQRKNFESEANTWE